MRKSIFFYFDSLLFLSLLTMNVDIIFHPFTCSLSTMVATYLYLSSIFRSSCIFYLRRCIHVIVIQKCISRFRNVEFSILNSKMSDSGFQNVQFRYNFSSNIFYSHFYFSISAFRKFLLNNVLK